MAPDRLLVQLQHHPVVPYPENVLQRFEAHRPIAADRRWTAVVPGKRVVFALEALDELAQVLHAGLDVGIHAEQPSGGGHHLVVPFGAGPRRQPGVAARFVQTHGARQVVVETIAVGLLADQVFYPHHLSV